MHTMIIGIAGGTGSGKTTLTDHLAAHFGPAISVVHHDNYYKRQDVPFEVRCQQNYDHPDAFDTDLMVQQLKELKAGHTISAGHHCGSSLWTDTSKRNFRDAKIWLHQCPCIPASKIPWSCTNPVGSNQWREGFRRNYYAYG